jgi:transcription initiation factor TFIIIB Brf1 subunit/transcription initiation factor TFIIB
VADWTSELDRCRVCSSVHLVRRLGEVECRDCGAVGQVAHANLDDQAWSEAAAAELAEEVERALARVLGSSRQRPPFAMS